MELAIRKSGKARLLRFSSFLLGELVIQQSRTIHNLHVFEKSTPEYNWGKESILSGGAMVVSWES